MKLPSVFLMGKLDTRVRNCTWKTSSRMDSAAMPGLLAHARKRW